MQRRWMTLASLPLLGMLCAQAQERALAGTDAEVNGESISESAVVQAGGAELAQLQQQVYRLKLQTLQRLIEERCLANEAAHRNLSVDALLDLEVRGKVPPVTLDDIHLFYVAHQDQFPGGETDALRERIREHLVEERTAARKDEFVRSLQAVQGVKLLLEPPAVFRAELKTGEAPTRGPVTAPVTIVEFEDFQCPYCKRSQAVLAQLRARYPDAVKVVHRDFPLLSLHPAAQRAHEAARCAGAQQKFWEFTDVLYANAPAASPAQLQEYAKQVGIDPAAFEHCLEQGTYRDVIEQDVSEGTQLGVTGTPTFFVNGQLLSGAQSLEAFQRLIDAELKRAGAPAASGSGN